MEIRKRYVCSVCGAEIVVTKASAGTIECHGQPLVLKQPSPASPR